MSGTAPKIDYDLLEEEKSLELQYEFTRKLATKANLEGTFDSLRQVVLKHVVDNQYERAHNDLDRFVEFKKDYPSFKRRSAPYVKHCHEILHAIEAKRNFPGMVSLSASKHQELLEKVVDHFEELKYYLKQVEIVEKEVKVEDMRSTAMVLRAGSYSVMAIFLLGFSLAFLDMRVGSSFMVVFDDMVSQVLDLVFSLFK